MVKDKDKTAVRAVGPWTRKKLEILEKYLSAYTTVLKGRKFNFEYVDAFAGAGRHKLKENPNREIAGSPRIALAIKFPFTHYHFIDTNPQRLTELEMLASGKSNVSIYLEDCNKVLLEKIIPHITSSGWNRAFFFLDPDGQNVQWPVIQACGQSKQIEILLNFSTMGMNLNATLNDPTRINAAQARNNTALWGDETWKDIVYRVRPSSLFPESEGILEKARNDEIMLAFRERLITKAGFAYVSNPVPFVDPRNGAAIYYLFFAGPNKTGLSIFEDIIKKIDKDGPNFWRLDKTRTEPPV